jgi:hypothetical protein
MSENIAPTRNGPSDFGEEVLQAAFGRSAMCAQHLKGSVDKLKRARRRDGTIDVFPSPDQMSKELADVIPYLTLFELAIAIRALRLVSWYPPAAWEWFENFATAVGRRIYGLDIEVVLITR